ncbi:MAG: pilus assembly protein [Elusimicrobiota bacterium]|jgi:hypothetical protein|nr:pilus assembly protein [Elusimicrobiota bacterium]
MNKNKNLKYPKGQALVEAALTAPLLVFFLFTIIWFAQVMLTHQQLVSGARYGMDLIANTPYSKSYIETSVKNYLAGKSVVGRIIDEKNLGVKVELHDLQPYNTEISFSNIGQIIQSILNFNGIKDLLLRTNSYIEVTYKYEYPKILKMTGSNNFQLKSRYEILSGNGSAGAKKRDS